MNFLTHFFFNIKYKESTHQFKVDVNINHENGGTEVHFL